LLHSLSQSILSPADRWLPYLLWKKFRRIFNCTTITGKTAHIPLWIKKRINIIVTIAVPWVTSPLKSIKIYSQKGKNTRIKGEGDFVAKKGIVEYFSGILTIPVQWMLPETKEN
jgi:hypothetical protein